MISAIAPFEPDRYHGACYKYRRFGLPGSAERAHLEDLIVSRKMMFASPSSFNDPYDCRPMFVRGVNPAEDRARLLKAWEEGRAQMGVPKPSTRERDRHISEVMAKLSTPEGAATHFKPLLDSSTGVFCMSRHWNLLTQWAYYADGGQGLCLEYAVKAGEGFDCVYPVDYAHERPIVEIARVLADEDYRTRILFTSVTTKALDWAHEKEVRALQMKPGLFVHPPNMLTSILLGAVASDENVTWLLATLEHHGIRVPVFQTALSAQSFSLERQHKKAIS